MTMPVSAPDGAATASLVVDVSSSSGVTSHGTIGVCAISPTKEKLDHETDSPFSDGTTLFPKDSAGQLFPNARFDLDLQAAIEAAQVAVVRQPLHGKMEFKNGFDYKYIPDAAFQGNDKAEFDVLINNENVRVLFYIKVIDANVSDAYEDIQKKYCPNSTWQIP
jgi:hypothetical protein